MSLKVLSDHSRLDNNNRAFIAFLKYILTFVLLLFPLTLLVTTDRKQNRG